ncbi:DUF3566 domain-containing protein [Actinomadura sp. DC4]|uniref:DUF3566 domain-containing protein n=1 Tax=Actinomadura sp. DC4 TaxID=3055069 RepID=UPI00339D3C2F
MRTNSTDDDTNGTVPKDDADETVTDVPPKDDEDTVRDAAPVADEDDEADATRIDMVPPSSSDRTSSHRTATFGLPKDLGEPDGEAAPVAKKDDIVKEPQESEAMPSSGRSAAMDSSTPPSSGFGGGRTAGGGGGGSSTPPSYAPSGAAAAPSAPPRPASTPRAAIEAASRALRKPEPGRKPARKAHLQVARFEPWSVMKFSFIMALVCFLVLFVAVAVLYVILSWLGVFDALSNTIHDLTSNDQGTTGGLNPASWFSAARILGYTALIGTLNVLLITALATVWSVIYNMAADLVGGVEVTLKEADQ